ncbi:MAG: tetratricopeptide repeat protein [Gemmatimonadota bacterium]|nr:tetratricopeptide repeat protein [Gemmatimonadota bacterium]
MSIESLKQQARRHEQNEEWRKALDQYKKALNALAQDEQSDIGLINRVGDLFVRVGALDDAVAHYEQAVDLYREAFLPNNAIAVCKKIIRNVPGRHQAYLKIGQIRAEQGFLPDARTNFLTYAERMQQAGDLDESFRALVEFCDLAPDDVQVRITVADQMAANRRSEEAVEQLLIAYRHLTQSGEGDLARGVETKIKELDPNVDVGAALASGGTAFGIAEEDHGGFESPFGEIDLSAPTEEEPEPVSGETEFAEIGGFEVDGAKKSLEEAAEEVAAEIPTMDLDASDDDEDGEAVELPMMGFDDSDDDDDFELPTLAFAEDDDEDEEVELPTIPYDDEDDDEVTAELLTVEAADDDGFESSAALEEAIEEAAPEPAPAPPAPTPPPAEPAAPAQDYVDFGAMILGGGGGDEKSTRFRVAYEEPSGDEEADFAKMLSQFKDKVSENLDSGDVRAHYDLGTAYKEMGLLEEAISSFQQALRASAVHLPTYEIMGQTFIEMGQPEAAVRTLERALHVTPGVEDEFVGIYYYLARAFEALDRKDSAVEYYDRVFSLDINFADVTERLRELR